MNHIPSAQLASVISPIERPEVPLIGQAYRQVGVRLWGQGAYERESIDGGDTQYKTLNRVELGDIIVNKIWARNGSVSVVWEDTAGCYASGEFPLFVCDPKQLDPRWFYYLTKTPDFWRQCEVKSHGTSGKNRIRPEKFLEIEIPLPPLDEQRRIVAQIDAIAEQVALARGLRHGAVEEAEALGASYIRDKVLSVEHETHSTVGDFCEIRGGIQKSAERLPGQNPRRYLTVAHVQRNWIDTADVRYFEVSDSELMRWRLLPGDVLVVEGNGSADQIGRTALFRGEIEDCVHQNHIIRVRPDQRRLMPEFLNLYLNSPIGQSEMKERSRTSSGLFHLSVERIRSIGLFVPAIEQQRAVVDSVAEIQAEGERLKRLQAAVGAELDALLPSVLDRAFRGEL